MYAHPGIYIHTCVYPHSTSLVILHCSTNSDQMRSFKQRLNIIEEVLKQQQLKDTINNTTCTNEPENLPNRYVTTYMYMLLLCRLCTCSRNGPIPIWFQK